MMSKICVITALLFSMTITLLGCHTMMSKRLLSIKPDTNARVERLLKYYHDMATLPPAMIQQEYEQQMRMLVREGCSEDLLRVGILLSLTPITFLPEKIDLDLLCPCLDNPSIAQSHLGYLAFFLHSSISEKVTQAEHYRSMVHMLNKEQHMLKKERHRNETLHRQLNELKAIEKSIHERKRSQNNAGEEE